MSTQLTKSERQRIAELLKNGFTKHDIAHALGRDRSTIFREVKRNSVNGEYLPDQAHRLAQQRRSQRPRQRKFDDPVCRVFMKNGLFEFWSPDQIAGRFRKEFQDQPERWFSGMAVYRWINQQPGRTFWRSFLRFGKRKKPGDQRGKLKATAHIADRPSVVDTKQRYGDWEGDTVLGARRQSALVTLTERKSGFALVGLIRRFKATNVSRQMQRLLDPLPQPLKRTMTLDNGKEFAQHRQVSRRCGIDIYFARPYHAWERGSNESFNGLLRQFFPKGTDFARLSTNSLNDVTNLLNNRPRKRLNYQTPNEVIQDHFPVAIEL